MGLVLDEKVWILISLLHQKPVDDLDKREYKVLKRLWPEFLFVDLQILLL